LTLSMAGVATATLTHSNCFGGTGTITAGANGGTGVYTFSKDGTTFQASATFNGLTAGIYTITAKDGNGCTGTAQATVTVPTQVNAGRASCRESGDGGTG